MATSCLAALVLTTALAAEASRIQHAALALDTSHITPQDRAGLSDDVNGEGSLLEQTNKSQPTHSEGIWAGLSNALPSPSDFMALVKRDALWRVIAVVLIMAVWFFMCFIFCTICVISRPEDAQEASEPGGGASSSGGDDARSLKLFDDLRNPKFCVGASSSTDDARPLKPNRLFTL
mmetsp:Transcript_72799/g.137712  ORF Transcript_72799/g.137712 Transcript_72799/m.137712 type:complete len:177 (-) Transcript_72799:89-619(-)